MAQQHIEATALGQGYYRVHVNGSQKSQHIAEREALEAAGKWKRDEPTADVYYDHDYHVRIDLVDKPVVAPPVDPVPEPPIVVPPIEPVAGLLIDRRFVTADEIASYHWVSGMQYAAGDPRAARYDSALGGAAIPIIPGEAMSSLLKDAATAPAPIAGRVFVEWDFYVPQSFYDLPFESMNWYTIKTFRIFNHAKRGVNTHVSATCTFADGGTDMWIRTAGTYASGTEMRLGYVPPADQWVTHRVTKDFDAMKLEFTSRSVAGEIHSKSVDMLALTPIDNIGALLHSTSRKLDNPINEHPTFFGYRNLKLGVE